jgi:hypothetical protein
MQTRSPQNIAHRQLLRQSDGVLKREEGHCQANAHSQRGRGGYGREPHRIQRPGESNCVFKGQYNTLFSVQNAPSRRNL